MYSFDWFRHTATASLTTYYDGTRVFRGAAASDVLNTAELTATPFRVPKATVVKTWGLRVTAGAAVDAGIHLGIFVPKNQMGQMYPGSLYADVGTLGLSATGLNTLASVVSLAAGPYYMVTVTTKGSVNARALSPDQCNLQFGRYPRGSTGENRANAIVVSYGYSMPTTYPAGGTLSSNNVPSIVFLVQS